MEKHLKLNEAQVKAIVRSILSEVSPYPTIYPTQTNPANGEDETMEKWNKTKNGFDRKTRGFFGRLYLKYLAENNPDYLTKVLTMIGDNLDKVREMGPAEMRGASLDSYLIYLHNYDDTNLIFRILENRAINPEGFGTDKRIPYLNYIHRKYNKQGLQPRELKGFDPHQLNRRGTGFRRFKVAGINEEKIKEIVNEILREGIDKL